MHCHPQLHEIHMISIRQKWQILQKCVINQTTTIDYVAASDDWFTLFAISSKKSVVCEDETRGEKFQRCF